MSAAKTANTAFFHTCFIFSSSGFYAVYAYFSVLLPTMSIGILVKPFHKM